ncbi:putative RNA-binding protein 7 [Triplophysa rosa]|uniref:RNA-binding protein 7 n=1 Tax=Triplophysa rosa TaxID=992332 RepID=A0A9W7WD72_TRIRA|nr:putative RNA-binding protein 7 [Triplophysa rosa]
MSVSDLEKSIFVGNIHSCVTEEILFELFLQAGPVEKVHIFRNGHQMPYGVVYYKHAEAVPYAVELLDGIWIYGQPIKLQCKYGRHYQENDIWCTTGMDSGVIANSKGAVHRDDMASDVNNSLGVENHCKTPHGWSDMVTRTFLNGFNRSTDPMICAFQLCQRLCGTVHPSSSGWSLDTPLDIQPG